MEYVIGVDGGSTKCLIKAKDIKGNTIAEIQGETTNHMVAGSELAEKRVNKLMSGLLKLFSGKKQDCRCIVVGAAGIDSPKDRVIVEGFYKALKFPCPVFCMNDGMVALHAVTKGVGLVAISGTGSIVVGRNAAGKMTRSGGYSLTIMGNEGSSRWISVMALNYMSKWVDKSVPTSLLVQKIDDFFHGFDAAKLSHSVVDFYKLLLNPELAVLVYEAARGGDKAAISILKKSAAELFKVAQTVVKKLGYKKNDHFTAGMWGSVFVNNDIYSEEYRRLFSGYYPNAVTVFPSGDAADGAASMAMDYLKNDVPLIKEY